MSGPPSPGRRLVRCLPNTLSALRIAGALAFPLVPREWRGWAAVAIGLTDFLDGWIARRFDARTALGGHLDGLADKLFTLVVIITLLVDHVLSPWAAVAILARDLCVAGIILFALAKGELRRAFLHAEAHLPGKATTAAVFACLALLLFFPDARGPGAVLQILAAGLSTLAGLDYVLRFARARAEWRANHPPS